MEADLQFQQSVRISAEIAHGIADAVDHTRYDLVIGNL